MSPAKAQRRQGQIFEARNSKHETRNKFKCSKKQGISNNFNLDSAFWIFFDFGFIWLRFVSVRGAAFVLRILDLFRWLPGGINFLAVVLFNILQVRMYALNCLNVLNA